MKPFIILLAALPSLAACDADEVLTPFDRTEYISIITNECNQGVTISYTCYNNSYSFHIEAGEEKVFEESIQWDFSAHNDEIGSVLFTFDDGTTLTHTCVKTESGRIFTPAENNILNANTVTSDNASWSIKSWKGNKMRYDYVFK